MSGENILLQVGQCGNQLGAAFWAQALREERCRRAAGASSAWRPATTPTKTAPPTEDVASHSASHSSSRSPPAHSASHSSSGGEATSWFATVRANAKSGFQLHSGGSRLKARAVLIDMEENVIGQLRRGPLGRLFEHAQLITDVSGAGNNWAHGHEVYGPQYKEQLCESIRQLVEECNALQSFFLLHSLGGGTGSGLGTYLLEALSDWYPAVCRFAVPVLPSATDDVVTSPYNCALALPPLVEFASNVLPVTNESLARMAANAHASAAARPAMLFAGQGETRPSGRATGLPPAAAAADKEPETQMKTKSPFEVQNNIVASLLSHLTSSMRYEGSLNVDLADICTNLTPYPRQNILVSALTPVPGERPATGLEGKRGACQRCLDLLRSSQQLIQVAPVQSRCLAGALLARGDVTVSDSLHAVQRLQQQLPWSVFQPAFKIGLCAIAAPGERFSFTGLFNSCGIRHVLDEQLNRFSRLYRRKAHLHHYTQYLSSSHFDETFESVTSLSNEYAALDAQSDCRWVPWGCSGAVARAHGETAAGIDFGAVGATARVSAVAGERGVYLREASKARSRRDRLAFLTKGLEAGWMDAGADEEEGLRGRAAEPRTSTAGTADRPWEALGRRSFPRPLL
eukprot:GHVT01061545.1.p1 GENE.GHVT01061545.1~~GHVT01061545.1.p1  ORF type:complete len:629 (-),score=125.88 GHVT01061545.1:448-2334(-)